MSASALCVGTDYSQSSVPTARRNSMGKDPAFLFYDGDAAKDVSHMNRLERGGYFDIIQAQRKFGAMNIDLIKKILGHDFEDVWEAIKPVMTYVDDMYHISWLTESTIERQNYCKSR